MSLRRVVLAIGLSFVIVLPGAVVIGLACTVLGWGSLVALVLGSIWGALVTNVVIAKVVFSPPTVRVHPSVTYTNDPRTITWRFPGEGRP